MVPKNKLKRIFLITFVSIIIFCTLFVGSFYGIKASIPKYNTYLLYINSFECVDMLKGNLDYKLSIGYKCGYMFWTQYPEYITPGQYITYNSSLSIIIKSHVSNINDLNFGVELFFKLKNVMYQYTEIFFINSLYAFETNYCELLEFPYLGGELNLNFSISLI